MVSFNKCRLLLSGFGLQAQGPVPEPGASVFDLQTPIPILLGMLGQNNK